MAIYSIDSFTFPACAACNQEYGLLEKTAKGAFKKLLNAESLSKLDFCVLLDWFDKIRIGLWLGYFFLDKNPGNIKPKYFIKSRIRKHDRMLLIIRVNEDEPMLNFRGVNTPSFYYTPSCFSIDVRNFTFLNVSSPYMFSERLGFPYPDQGYWDKDEKVACYGFSPGTKKLSVPILPIASKFDGTQIIQPIYYSTKDHPYYLTNNYIREHSYDLTNGLGEIFCFKDNEVSIIPKAESLIWLPVTSYGRNELHPDISILTIELQMMVDKMLPSAKLLPKDRQKWWAEMVNSNIENANRLIARLKENALKLT